MWSEVTLAKQWQLNSQVKRTTRVFYVKQEILFDLKCPYNQLLDLHFFTFS